MSEAARREFSEESNTTTLSEGIARALKYTTLTEPFQEEPEESPEQLLKRTLSTKSIISTTSSFAARMQQAAMRSGPERNNFRIIGLGSCGTVFEIPGTEMACKKGTEESDIFRDFRLTNKVHQAVKDVRVMMQTAFPDYTVPKTPRCHEYHPANDKNYWSQNLRRFPAGYRTNQPLFTVDHILPLSKATREALIEMYFDSDEEIQQEAKDDPKNRDCLARIYLGERESVRRQCDEYDTLRNFPLRLNMMEDLDLEVSDLAKEMALGLAITHWQAQVDGMDMEFVLGSSATWDGDGVSAAPNTGEILNFQRRETHLWVFDFDKATEFELTKHDVDSKLVPAFIGNDPYYPRPQVDEELWDEFCGVYLEASEIIFRGKGVDQPVRHLPQRFLTEVRRVLKETEDWNEEDNIVFSN